MNAKEAWAYNNTEMVAKVKCMNKDGSWGYTPQIEDVRTVSDTVLEMTAQTMDVTGVVRAILDNSIQPDRE